MGFSSTHRHGFGYPHGWLHSFQLKIVPESLHIVLNLSGLFRSRYPSRNLMERGIVGVKYGKSVGGYSVL